MSETIVGNGLAIAGNDCRKLCGHRLKNRRKRFGHCRKRSSERILVIVGSDFSEKIWSMSEKIVGNDVGIDGSECRKRLSEKILPLTAAIDGKIWSLSEKCRKISEQCRK